MFGSRPRHSDDTVSAESLADSTPWAAGSSRDAAKAMTEKRLYVICARERGPDGDGDFGPNIVAGDLRGGASG